MTLPNSTSLKSRALDTPKESKRQCAWSTSHISCPATQYEGFTADGLQIKFPLFPSSGDLVKELQPSIVVTFDGIKPNDCNNFDFGIIKAPNSPGKTKPVYAGKCCHLHYQLCNIPILAFLSAEHVLEAQMVCIAQYFPPVLTCRRCSVKLTFDSCLNSSDI